MTNEDHIKNTLFLSFLINAKIPQRIKNAEKFALRNLCCRSGICLDCAVMLLHFCKAELSCRKPVCAKPLFLLVSIFVLNCKVPASELIIYLKLIMDKCDAIFLNFSKSQNNVKCQEFHTLMGLTKIS